MGKIRSVLFICTGNSCRSVMAEGLMKKYLRELGKSDIEVRSAGISAADGFFPTAETIEVMNREGVDVSDFKTKTLTLQMIESADIMLVMEDIHMNYITRLMPTASSKTHLLKGFQAECQSNFPENCNIPDPIGRPMDYYQLAFAVIKDQVKRIAEIL